MQEKILILDFGGQYNQLIARRVREQNVYCEIKPYTTTLDEIRAFAPMGIIFTGGPTACIWRNLPTLTRRCSGWAFPSWAFATAAS